MFELTIVSKAQLYQVRKAIDSRLRSVRHSKYGFIVTKIIITKIVYLMDRDAQRNEIKYGIESRLEAVKYHKVSTIT